MGKNYDNWNKYQEELENSDRNHSFKEGEVWWTAVGMNIGQEMDGKNEYYTRPVLIVRKFSREMMWVVPITSSDKRGTYFFMLTIEGKSKTASLLQMKAISSKRLLRKIEDISKIELFMIRNKLIDLLV